MSKWTRRGMKERAVAARVSALATSLYVQKKDTPEAGDPVALCEHGDLGGKHMFRLGSKGVDKVSVPFSFVFLCDDCCPAVPFEEDRQAWLSTALPALDRVGFLPDDMPPEKNN